MNDVSFSIPEVMKWSWTKVKGAKGKFFAVAFSLSILSWLCKLLPQGLGMLGIRSTMLPQVLNPLSKFLSTFALQPSLQYFGIQRAVSRDIDYAMLKQVFNVDTLPKIALLGFLKLLVYAPAIALSVFCFVSLWDVDFTTRWWHVMPLAAAAGIVTGIVLIYYLQVRMCVATAIVLIEKKSPWSALKTSFRATKAKQGQLVLLFLMNHLLVTVLAILTLGIGLIWLGPYCYIVQGVIYWKLVQPDKLMWPHSSHRYYSLAACG